MPLPQWLLTLSGWVYFAIVLACLLTALVRKREPAHALGWSLAIVFLPLLGPILFVTFGCTQISRRLARKIEHHESFEGGDSTQRAPATERSPYPDTRWGTLGRVMEGLGQAPRRAGNRTELYTDGPEAYAEMERAILDAKHHVHVEFYIFRDDEVGRNAIDVLCQKVREGVEVRMILDAAGSLGGARLRRKLQKTGGKVASFLPLLHFSKLASPNLRNHRKIVICDGRVAFFGGLNVGKEYLGRRRTRGREWADLHMRLEGPAVADLQWMFVEDWDYCTGELIEGPRYFPAIDAVGDATVQVVAGGPDLRPNPVRQAYLGAIIRAKRRIRLVTPYLIPDLALRDVLAMAARSGVDVKILTQHPPPDQWIPYLCTLSYCEELAESGVHIHGYAPGTVHAKALAVDGEWAMLGTANLDNRSMFLNFELMTLFDDDTRPGEIEGAIETLLARSVRLDRAWIQGLPLYKRLSMRAARLLAPLL